MYDMKQLSSIRPAMNDRIQNLIPNVKFVGMCFLCKIVEEKSWITYEKKMISSYKYMYFCLKIYKQIK